MLTVQIVEDDPNVRMRLMQCIQNHPRLCLTAQSQNFAEGKRALTTQPDILLVDLGLPDGDGTELIRLACLKNQGKTQSIVFSIFGDEQRVVQAIEAGASGYLLKDTPASTIASSIIEVSQGFAPISPAIAMHLLKRFHIKPQSSPESSPVLSVREVEVLEQLAQGLNMQEVADKLYISYHTVTAHTRKIYGKLNVHSRTAAIATAKQLGVLHC